MNNEQFSCPALFWSQRGITAGSPPPGIGRDALASPLRRFTRSVIRGSLVCALPALSVVWVTQFAGGNPVKYGGGPLGCGAAAATFGVP